MIVYHQATRQHSRTFEVYSWRAVPSIPVPPDLSTRQNRGNSSCHPFLPWRQPYFPPTRLSKRPSSLSCSEDAYSFPFQCCKQERSLGRCHLCLDRRGEVDFHHVEQRPSGWPLKVVRLIPCTSLCECHRKAHSSSRLCNDWLSFHQQWQPYKEKMFLTVAHVHLLYSAFSHDVTAAMLVYQNKETGGHIGVPNQSIETKTVFLCKQYSLFWLKRMNTDKLVKTLYLLMSPVWDRAIQYK